MDMVMEGANDSRKRNKIDPLVIPEILANILGFLDPTSLHVCTQITHLWRSISLNIAWRIYIIGEPYFFDCAGKDIDSGDNHDITDGNQIVSDSKLSDFSRNCSKIRSLSICETILSRLAYIRYGHLNWSLSDKGLHYLQAPGLKNLVHLKIQLPMVKLLKPCDILLIHDEMRSLLCRNPHIRDLELEEVGTAMAGSADPLLRLLEATENQLRRLSIVSSLTYEINITKIFQFLMDSNKRRLQLTETCPENSNTGRGGVVLDELVVHNRFVEEHGDGAFVSLQAQELASISGSLSLNSLTLLGFETGNIYTFEEYLAAGIEYGTFPTNGSLLIILRKCPLLERLCVGPDLSLMDKPSPRDFHSRLLDSFPQKDSDELWIPEIAGFVKEMHQACPKLKSIDFGMMYELSSSHWQEMTAIYGPQLKSFKVCNVQEFSTHSLLNLIGPPLNHITRTSNRNLYCLSELDISGIGSLYDCAWLVFAHIPTLKRLAARNVPLDASKLIGYDWVCKDIESLEIFVLIPKQWWPKTDHWVWDNTSGEWSLLSWEDGSEYNDVDISEQGQQESSSWREQSGSESSSESEDGYEEKYGKKRRKADDGRKREKKKRSKSHEKEERECKEEHKVKKRRKEKSDRKDKTERKVKREHKERKRKEKKKDKKESIPTGVDSQRRSKRKRKGLDSSTSDPHPSQETTTGAPTAADLQAMRPKDYTKYVQVQVCEQLGRLRKLRSLTLEGERDYWYQDCEWDCLELTIDTGLDRLEPLQNSLERLVIYQLQEKLCGPKEMDWIARHWVHHCNSRWLQTHQPWVQLGNRPAFVSNNASDSQEHIMSYPVFKELIGISIRGWDRSVIKTNLVLAWFQEECPTVTVEKDVLSESDDFSFGRFQEY
ncbi:hypothetical protein BGX21_001069 [Mortierella sp. AD011]|nr:hypothetical protein BGX20_008327 [Mortierella sp. AD010]KAF9385408.1 hypothetical protein BGX21_001069 [Mortierella sp. AD011]